MSTSQIFSAHKDLQQMVNIFVQTGQYLALCFRTNIKQSYPTQSENRLPAKSNTWSICITPKKANKQTNISCTLKIDFRRDHKVCFVGKSSNTHAEPIFFLLYIYRSLLDFVIWFPTNTQLIVPSDKDRSCQNYPREWIPGILARGEK